MRRVAKGLVPASAGPRAAASRPPLDPPGNRVLRCDSRHRSEAPTGAAFRVAGREGREMLDAGERAANEDWLAEARRASEVGSRQIRRRPLSGSSQRLRNPQQHRGDHLGFERRRSVPCAGFRIRDDPGRRVEGATARRGQVGRLDASVLAMGYAGDEARAFKRVERAPHSTPLARPPERRGPHIEAWSARWREGRSPGGHYLLLSLLERKADRRIRVTRPRSRRST